ncbi:MAG: hydroxyacylglutathione hydrolase [Rhodoferax sp.]|nr:hydroxyacylglutathione hydrolase [Rhodoferax sp.]
MTLVPLPAFNDNYIWMLHDGQRALVVDPGDPQVVFEALERTSLQLQAILVTHHHHDHTGGVNQLRKTTAAQVYGPAHENVPQPLQGMKDGDVLDVLGWHFTVLDVPGHTAGHIAFYSKPAGQEPLVFCGDTLFSAGCGRLFEGSPAQMLNSLTRLAALPDATRVCCAHEYTESGLLFAHAVEPANLAVTEHQRRVASWRANHQPSLPSTIGLEKSINPFLRTRQPDVVAAARHFDASVHTETDVFTAIRTWKNQF